MTYPNFTIRALIARERLIERLAINAGANPNSGTAPGDGEALTLAEETDAERADRLAYRHTFRERAVSEIAGLMDGSHVRVWRAASDGSMTLAAPLWAGQTFFEEGRDAECLILDREEWDRVLGLRHPLTELGEMTAAVLAGSTDTHSPPADLGELWTLHEAAAWIATGDPDLTDGLPDRVRELSKFGRDGHLTAWVELAAIINHKLQEHGDESNDEQAPDLFEAVDRARDSLRRAAERGQVRCFAIPASRGARRRVPAAEFVGAELWHGRGTRLHRIVDGKGEAARWLDLRFRAEDVRALAPHSGLSPNAPDVKTKKPRGRPPGSGGFRRADEPLLQEMRRLVTQGVAMSGTDAARIVSPRAKGASAEAAYDRLRKRYQELEDNGGK